MQLIQQIVDYNEMKVPPYLKFKKAFSIFMLIMLLKRATVDI